MATQASAVNTVQYLFSLFDLDDTYASAVSTAHHLYSFCDLGDTYSPSESHQIRYPLPFAVFGLAAYEVIHNIAETDFFNVFDCPKFRKWIMAAFVFLLSMAMWEQSPHFTRYTGDLDALLFGLALSMFLHTEAFTTLHALLLPPRRDRETMRALMNDPRRHDQQQRAIQLGVRYAVKIGMWLDHHIATPIEHTFSVRNVAKIGMWLDDHIALPIEHAFGCLLSMLSSLCSVLGTSVARPFGSAAKMLGSLLLVAIMMPFTVLVKLLILLFFFAQYIWFALKALWSKDEIEESDDDDDDDDDEDDGGDDEEDDEEDEDEEEEEEGDDGEEGEDEDAEEGEDDEGDGGHWGLGGDGDDDDDDDDNGDVPWFRAPVRLPFLPVREEEEALKTSRVAGEELEMIPEAEPDSEDPEGRMNSMQELLDDLEESARLAGIELPEKCGEEKEWEQPVGSALEVKASEVGEEVVEGEVEADDHVTLSPGIEAPEAREEEEDAASEASAEMVELTQEELDKELFGEDLSCLEQVEEKPAEEKEEDTAPEKAAEEPAVLVDQLNESMQSMILGPISEQTGLVETLAEAQAASIEDEAGHDTEPGTADEKKTALATVNTEEPSYATPNLVEIPSNLDIVLPNLTEILRQNGLMEGTLAKPPADRKMLRPSTRRRVPLENGNTETSLVPVATPTDGKVYETSPDPQPLSRDGSAESGKANADMPADAKASEPSPTPQPLSGDDNAQTAKPPEDRKILKPSSRRQRMGSSQNPIQQANLNVELSSFGQKSGISSTQPFTFGLLQSMTPALPPISETSHPTPPSEQSKSHSMIEKAIKKLEKKPAPSPASAKHTARPKNLVKNLIADITSSAP